MQTDSPFGERSLATVHRAFGRTGEYVGT